MADKYEPNVSDSFYHHPNRVSRQGFKEDTRDLENKRVRANSGFRIDKNTRYSKEVWGSKSQRTSCDNISPYNPKLISSSEINPANPISNKDSQSQKSTTCKSIDYSNGVSSSMNHFLSKEVKYRDNRNKLDEYVSSERDKIFARMKVPIHLTSNQEPLGDNFNISSIDEIPFEINKSSFLGSKSLFLSDLK